VSNTPYGREWAVRATNNGGSPSMSSVLAVDKFCLGLIADGIYTNQKVVTAFPNDGLAAALTPIIRVNSLGLSPWTNNNFVAGDLSVGGLQGDGVNKHLVTGATPAEVWDSDGDCGITIYSSGTGFTDTRYDFGHWSAGGPPVCSVYLYWGGTTYFDCWNSTGGRTSGAAPSNGYFCCTRTSTSAEAIYKGSSSGGHAILVSATGQSSISNRGTTSAHIMHVFGFNGASSTYSDKRFSYVGLHTGMDSTQSAYQYARVQQLRTDLGGGYV